MDYRKNRPILATLLQILFLLLLWGCAATTVETSTPPQAVATSPAPPTATLSDPAPIPASTRVAADPSPTLEPTVTNTPTLVPTASPTPAEADTATACACDTCPCQIKHVVIISIDGLRPDAIDQADTPTLDALRAQGAYSPAAKTVLPSVTLVSHASMLSGMSPAKHGIYWNSNDPDLGQVKGPTLFGVAHEAGLSTAMIVGKPKLEHLVLPNSVDNFDYAGFTDLQVTNEAVTVIETAMPAVLFIHLPDVDSAGHALGWMSPGQLLALSFTDGLLGEIVAALQAQGYLGQTLFIVTADHGGSGKKHGTGSAEDMTIPWLAVGPGVPAGLTLPSEIVTYDTAATALYALGLPIPAEWDGRPVLEIFEPHAGQE